jgi:hypothetical protein
MAEFSRSGSPMEDESGAVVGEISGLTVVLGDGRYSVEVHGVVRGVGNFGWDDARFTAKVPIGEGWGLVKLSEWQKRGDE